MVPQINLVYLQIKRIFTKIRIIRIKIILSDDVNLSENQQDPLNTPILSQRNSKFDNMYLFTNSFHLRKLVLFYEIMRAFMTSALYL